MIWRRVRSRAFLLFLIAAFLFLPGRFLVVDEQPQKADVIIVLTGDSNGSRIEKGMELWKRELAPYIMISGHQMTIADIQKQVRHSGMSDWAFILEPKAESTYENAFYTKDLMRKYNFNSALVVSSNYHMRRVKILFKNEYRASGINLTYCAANDPDFSPNCWWENPTSFVITIKEYTKTIGYLLTGRPLYEKIKLKVNNAHLNNNTEQTKRYGFVNAAINV